jgi:hypothetical protein
MNVRVIFQGAAPGMQHRGDSEFSAQPLFVSAKFEQGLRCVSEQQVVNQLTIGFGCTAKLGGQREDNVEVVRRQYSLQASSDPFCLRYCRTGRAMAIVTRVVRWSVATTIATVVHMPTELGSSTTL